MGALWRSKSPSVPVFRAALQRKCSCGGSSGLTGSCPECEKRKLVGQPLQSQLRINVPGDAYEQEAERAADRVMRMTESEVTPDHLQSGALVQRRIAAEDLASAKGLMIQRADSAGGVPASGGVTPNDSANQEGDSRCPSWRQDPQSISKRAAEFYVRNHMTPPSQATVERTVCEPPRDNGNYGCSVHFSDGLVIRVIVRATDIVVGSGPGPFTTETPPPGTPLCFYEYSCPAGDLVLTVKECKSAKPAAQSGPTLVGQRLAAPGASGATNAGPAVTHVLATPGQPLDATTRGFFAGRFGHDFSNVRIHAGAEAAESARSVDALAYTVGSHVVFGAGQYVPGSHTGRQLIAHELAHVIQQSGKV